MSEGFHASFKIHTQEIESIYSWSGKATKPKHMQEIGCCQTPAQNTDTIFICSG